MNAMTNAKAPDFGFAVRVKEEVTNYEKQDECGQMAEPHAASRPSEMYDKRDCRETHTNAITSIASGTLPFETMAQIRPTSNGTRRTANRI